MLREGALHAFTAVIAAVLAIVVLYLALLLLIMPYARWLPPRWQHRLDVLPHLILLVTGILIVLAVILKAIGEY